MKINITDLKQVSGVSSDFTFTEFLPPILFQASRIEFVGPVDIVGQVTNVGYGFLVRGTIQGTLRLECSRCLEGFEFPLTDDFTVVFRPLLSGERAEPEETETGLDIYRFTDDTIDLTDVVQESIILAIPMQPICQGSCQGLCPTCGKSLNSGSCQCREESIDPRLADLTRIAIDKPE